MRKVSIFIEIRGKNIKVLYY